MAMMAAHTMGVEVGFGTAVILGALSAVSACGASGVAGGSLLLIPLALRVNCRAFATAGAASQAGNFSGRVC